MGHLPTNPDTCPIVGSARSDRLGSPVKQPDPTRGGLPITATQSSSLPALSTLPQAWPSTSSRRLAVDAAAPSLPGHSGKLSQGSVGTASGLPGLPIPGPGLLPPSQSSGGLPHTSLIPCQRPSTSTGSFSGGQLSSPALTLSPGSQFWGQLSFCSPLAALVAQRVRSLPAMRETWV